MGGQNRIVVDYGDYEGLVLLGAFNTKSGVEITQTELQKLDGFEIVTRYKTWGETFDLLKDEISKDKEGYVIRFKNGFRLKVKGDEYKRLHRILTNISNRDIWEYLKDDKSFDEILDRVPDEFYGWVKETIKSIMTQYHKIETEYRLLFLRIINDNKEIDKKLFAEIAKKYEYPSILFSLYNNKDYKKIIWKLIYPKYSKPFKKDEN